MVAGEDDDEGFGAFEVLEGVLAAIRATQVEIRGGCAEGRVTGWKSAELTEDSAAKAARKVRQARFIGLA